MAGNGRRGMEEGGVEGGKREKGGKGDGKKGRKEEGKLETGDKGGGRKGGKEDGKMEGRKPQTKEDEGRGLNDRE